MRILVQHIENLLPEHDCVVVPGLGGFVQNEVHAKINEETKLFYPATKEICFNPRLKFNDGLLAQSYQEMFGMSFEEANIQIQHSVQEILNKLEEGKFVRIGRIGTLNTFDGQLTFRPDHKNHFLPESYGLFTFSFPTLPEPSSEQVLPGNGFKLRAKDQKRQNALEQKRSDSVVNEKKSTLLIELENAKLLASVLEAHGMGLPNYERRLERRHRNKITQTMVGLCVFVFVLLLAKPAGQFSKYDQQANLMLHQHYDLNLNSMDSSIQTIASTIPSAVITPAESTMSLVRAATDALVGTKRARLEQNQINIHNPEANILDRLQETLSIRKSPRILTKTPDPKFYVIVSTFSERSTAEAWLSLHSNDLAVKGATIVELNGWYRISTSSFKNKSEAKSYLTGFTFTHPEYASAWIYGEGM